MSLIIHELKQSAKSLLIWTIAITSFMIICVVIYPEMKGEMGEMNDMFASMGSFSKAFGLDVLNFGSLPGYYAIECGNVLGIGGALFAAIIGISALAKEEGGHTAEFLFSHPISRNMAVSAKAFSLLIQLVVLNCVVFTASAISIVLIDEEVFWKELFLLHFAYFLLQVEIAAICFFFSSILRSGSYGLGLGFALVLYFVNLMANITEKLDKLKYITPFSFAEASDIIHNCEIETKYLCPGMIVGLVCIIVSYFVYNKKDLAG